MDDFTYDVIQKSRLAKNAWAKKGGSRSKSCRLPHEYMTKKEVEKMHGDVQKWNLSGTMGWGTFLTMPHDLQLEYVTKLRETYNASDAKIAEMFGTSQANISNFFNNRGLAENKVRRMTNDQKCDWIKFCMGDPAKTPAPVFTAEPEEVKHVNILEGYVPDEEEEDVSAPEEEDTKVFRAHNIPAILPSAFTPCEEPKKMPTFNNIAVNLTGTPAEIELGLNGILGILPYDGKFKLTISIVREVAENEM